MESIILNLIYSLKIEVAYIVFFGVYGNQNLSFKIPYRISLRGVVSTVEIFTGAASVSDPEVLEDQPLIRTNLGLFLPHNLRPALISLGSTIYDLAGFGSGGYMERFQATQRPSNV